MLAQPPQNCQRLRSVEKVSDSVGLSRRNRKKRVCSAYGASTCAVGRRSKRRKTEVRVCGGGTRTLSPPPARRLHRLRVVATMAHAHKRKSRSAHSSLLLSYFYTLECRIQNGYNGSSSLCPWDPQLESSSSYTRIEWQVSKGKASIRAYLPMRPTPAERT